MAGARTTELDAVNTMLSAVGEPPIASLDEQKNVDAALAQNILTEVSRDVQTQGWHFNTQREVTFTPDSTTNKITIGDDVARVDIDHWTSSGSTTSSVDTRDIAQRGSVLFDRKDNTYEFTSIVKATVVYILDWEELPEPARRYSTVKAARVFQDRMVGSQAHHAFSREDEVRALALLKEFEGDTADHSVFDNYDVFRIVSRPDAMRGGYLN